MITSTRVKITTRMANMLMAIAVMRRRKRG